MLIFKPVLWSARKGVKGNVDAELVLQTMVDYPHYRKAVIVTGDGDFYCLVKYLYEQGKLLRVLIPNRYKYSVLLRRAVPSTQYLAFMNDLRKRVEYTKNP
ncbi:MAG: NYN domain-containing protein [candidate division KSB1 bacterium]|nr:NYN domain-containing protein [candidate division KSB1 bacterium]MDZ7303904.1 NYN domain-containing protein [candidate division KSB1 bacterium]MDZ7313065.1 NYN domain-containing protein [candidate division KSB1 bacterium]